MAASGMTLRAYAWRDLLEQIKHRSVPELQIPIVPDHLVHSSEVSLE
jgi:hypothetical protein